jgi:shikimate kinase
MTLPRRHVMLVGLSGAGKTTTGALVAEQLDTHVTDIDRVIERSTGLAVSQVFGAMGEAAFRDRERDAVLEALMLPPHVVCPGAGWAAQPGHLEAVRDRAFTVYLRVSPEAAAARLDGTSDRPLLASEPLEVGLRRQLERREPFYLAADATVDAEQPPERVADTIAFLARERGGW